MNISQIMTGSITIEIIKNRPSLEGWMGISAFLLFLLSILVFTTTYKSKKMKELKEKVMELEYKIMYLKNKL